MGKFDNLITPDSDDLGPVEPAEEGAGEERVSPPDNPTPEETPAPETEAQETPAPETYPEETPAPETEAQETPAPETEAQETPAPETEAQETAEPDIRVEETPAPETYPEETPEPEIEAPDLSIPDTADEGERLEVPQALDEWEEWEEEEGEPSPYEPDPPPLERFVPKLLGFGGSPYLGTSAGLSTSWFAQLATSNLPFAWRQQDEDEGTSGSRDPADIGDFCRTVIFYEGYPMYITTFFKLAGAGQLLQCRAWVDNRLSAGEFCVVPLFVPSLIPCPINAAADVEPQAYGAQLLPYFPNGSAADYNSFPLVIEVAGMAGGQPPGKQSGSGGGLINAPTTDALVPPIGAPPYAPADPTDGKISGIAVGGIYPRLDNYGGYPRYRQLGGPHYIWFTGTKWRCATAAGSPVYFESQDTLVSLYSVGSFYSHWWVANGAEELITGTMRSRAQRSVAINSGYNWGTGFVGGAGGGNLFEGDMLSVLAVCSAPANWDWATAATGAAALTVTLDGAVVAPIVTAESISGSTP